tara:strand:- start:4203 stop:4574 length:372 start_codon:yes stop_codon:yes gene_type:complete
MNFKKEISFYPNLIDKEKIIKQNIILRFLKYFLLTIFNLNFILNLNLRANENFKVEIDAIIILMEDFKKSNLKNQNLKISYYLEKKLDNCNVIIKVKKTGDKKIGEEKKIKTFYVDACSKVIK